MKPMHIDFSERGWRRALSLFSLAEWLLLVLLVLAAVIGVATVDNISARAAQSEARLAQREAGAERRDERQPRASQPVSAQAVSAANEAIRQLNLPWNELLSAVERGTPRRIALLSVEPDFARRRIKLEAEAASPDSMLDYADGLRAAGFFSAVALVRHEANDSGSGTALRFVVEAAWRELSDE